MAKRRSSSPSRAVAREVVGTAASRVDLPFKMSPRLVDTHQLMTVAARHATGATTAGRPERTKCHGKNSVSNSQRGSLEATYSAYGLMMVLVEQTHADPAAAVQARLPAVT